MAISFSLSPMSSIVNLKSGETNEEILLKVTNPMESEKPIHYKITVLPYGVTDNSYTADLMSETERTIITKWIKIEKDEGIIEPNETAEIPVKIVVPENAPAGGQYCAIAVSMLPDETEKGEGISFDSVYEMTSLVYANVDGKTIRESSIINNIVPAYSSIPKVTVATTLENKGNTHEYAMIEINVKNFFSGEDVFEVPEGGNRYTEVIMPDSVRYATRDVNNLPAIGLFRIEQKVRMNSDVSNEERIVLVAPLWFILLATATIVSLIALIVTRITKAIRAKK